MRPRSSNVPTVRVVLARQVILQESHQVLEDVDVLAPGTQHCEALHQLGTILGGQLVPITLARIGHEAAPAGRRAISV